MGSTPVVGAVMKESPAAVRKRARLFARRVKAGSPEAVRKQKQYDLNK